MSSDHWLNHFRLHPGLSFTSLRVQPQKSLILPIKHNLRMYHSIQDSCLLLIAIFEKNDFCFLKSVTLPCMYFASNVGDLLGWAQGIRLSLTLLCALTSWGAHVTGFMDTLVVCPATCVAVRSWVHLLLVSPALVTCESLISDKFLIQFGS